MRIANIKIIYGAPCSGKSTYVNSVITENDIKFDYDLILQAISNSELHENRELLRSYGVGIRGFLLDFVGDDIENFYVIACKITEKLSE